MDYLSNNWVLQHNIFLSSDGFLKKLQECGYRIADSNDPGPETDESGSLECNYGEKNIFTLGALRRAAVFECMAAKEIARMHFSSVRIC